MDSSRYVISPEGCSSSESGWTMYIASPMQEDPCSGDDDDSQNNNIFTKHIRAKTKPKPKTSEDSDDSMASDASSGPSYLQQKSVVKGKNEKAAKNASKKKEEKQEKKKRGKRFFF